MSGLGESAGEDLSTVILAGQVAIAVAASALVRTLLGWIAGRGGCSRIVERLDRGDETCGYFGGLVILARLVSSL
jgi:hypothetical protein